MVTAHCRQPFLALHSGCGTVLHVGSEQENNPQSSYPHRKGATIMPGPCSKHPSNSSCRPDLSSAQTCKPAQKAVAFASIAGRGIARCTHRPRAASSGSSQQKKVLTLCRVLRPVAGAPVLGVVVDLHVLRGRRWKVESSVLVSEREPSRGAGTSTASAQIQSPSCSSGAQRGLPKR